MLYEPPAIHDGNESESCSAVLRYSRLNVSLDRLVLQHCLKAWIQIDRRMESPRPEEALIPALSPASLVLWIGGFMSPLGFEAASS